MYPKPTPTEFFQFAGDIIRISNLDRNVLGKYIYSIAFASGGCIFTKHIIVHDEQRGGLGNVGFSIYIPNGKQVSGVDMKLLLDELVKTYCQNYCPDYYLNNKQEDWLLFTSLANSYDSKLRDVSSNDFENLQSGNVDEAFIYYTSDSELQKYFDNPFQEEYAPYRQILFISSDLNGKSENPLNALRNSGENLTGKIDLENGYYFLNNYNRSKGVTIIANGKPRSDGKNNNCIRAKWPIEIRYSKDEQCFEPIESKGTLFDPEISQYLKIIKGNQINVEYDAFNIRTPKTKKNSFVIKDRKGNFKTDAEIQIGMQPWEKISGYQYEYTFKGEELIKQWNISVKKDDSLAKIEIIPINQIGNVDLILEERLIVTIIVTDENTGVNLDDFEISTKLKNGFHKTNQLEFVDDQIIDSYTITIRRNGYEDKDIKDFLPYKQKRIETTLKKKTILDGKLLSPYNVSAGKYGTLKNNYNYSSNSDDGSDVKDCIIPNEGYAFSHFILQNEILIAQYKKKESIFRNPKLIAGLSVGTIVLGLGIWLLISYLKPSKKEVSINLQEIQNYTTGDSLLLNKLQVYKTSLENQVPKIEEKGGGILGLLGIGEKQIDSADYKEWNNAMQNLDNTITKRKLINDKDFAKLKKLPYFSRQEEFKSAIEKIDSNKYGEVKIQLGDISNLTLTEISAKLQKESPKESPEKKMEEQNRKTSKEMKETKKLEGPKLSKESNNINSKLIEKPAKTLPQNQESVKTKEIKKELKGGSITKNKLEEYGKIYPEFKSSFHLYLDFWEKVKNKNSKSDFVALLKKVRKDDTLKNSELEKILSKICEDDNSFQNFSDAPGKAKCETLDELNNKIKK
ncbi:hypothetical protein FEDK69T_18760 [Flavobacterium enshiense DK69]|nr:hypothetical protein FEDK69T_18760 [Flavobacterium enshiense DK69]